MKTSRPSSLDLGPAARRSPLSARAALVLATILAACSTDGSGPASPCGAGRTACAGSCVETTTDPAHCGACGKACAAGQVCSQGACTLECAKGASVCGGACVDPKVDPANCGSCGNACPADQHCVSGACACEGTLSSCDGGSGPVCINTSMDPAHCGACGNACAGDQLCGNGQCFCPSGSIECSGACVDPKTNKQYCGATDGCGSQGGTEGKACAAGWYCTHAVCRGCRTWVVEQTYTAVPSSSVILADLTGDGVLDLVVGGVNAKVTIMRGVGDGSFQAIQLLETGYGAPRVGDLDGNGALDLVVPDQSKVNVFYGHGDGTFPLAPKVVNGPDGSYLGAGALKDLNGDGRLDIVSYGLDQVYVMLQAADQSAGSPAVFQPATSYPTTLITRSVVAADVNGDGKLDLVTTDEHTDYLTVFVGNAGVLLGNGNGTFQPYVPYPTSPGVNQGTVSDLDMDGALDLVTVSPGSARADLLRGHGDGTFDPPIAIATGTTSGEILVSDITEDGVPDLAYLNPDALRVRTGGGGGQLLPAKSFPIPPSATGLAAGDLNGDGLTDLVVVSFTSAVGVGTVTILLGTIEPECQ